MKAALPILTKAHTRDDLHPSVGLLAGAALLGMRLVAAGKFEPDASARSWRVSPLEPDDRRPGRPVGPGPRVRRPRAGRRPRRWSGRCSTRSPTPCPATPRTAPAQDRPTAAATTGRPPADAAGPSTPTSRPGCRPASSGTAARPSPAGPTWSASRLRVEADEEELVAGAVRLVLQVYDEQNPLHVRDASVLWHETNVDHGFGDRARTHLLIALRAAAEAWPVLERLLELRVPDQLTLDTDELVSLLSDGVGALQAAGVDVLWPRSLGRDLTATTVLDRAPRPRHPRPTAARQLLRARDALRLQLADRAARRAALRGGDGPAGRRGCARCSSSAATGP